MNYHDYQLFQCFYLEANNSGNHNWILINLTTLLGCQLSRHSRLEANNSCNPNWILINLTTLLKWQIFQVSVILTKYQSIQQPYLNANYSDNSIWRPIISLIPTGY